MDYFEFLKEAKGVRLNNQQIEASSFDKGTALVLSTAGSGKTTVTIARAGKLLYENKCREKILTITFSKMAANDMKSRFQSYFGDTYKAKTEFSTIHAFSYKIVRDFYRRKGIDFELLTNNYSVLAEVLRSFYSKSYFSYVSDEEVENLSSAIGYADNMMINPSEYENYGIEIKGFDEIYEAYKEYKAKNRLVDFDDMLVYAHRIISGSERYREQIRNTYQYIQVDEVQDTSKIQHEIIKLITYNNLFMVGDDDQAIYSFRGSYPDFLIEFKNIYKYGKIFFLENNYRCDKNIVDGAKNFIEINKNRYKKSIRTDNPKVNDINIVRTASRAEQARMIIKELEHTGDDTVGILFRNNISAMILATNLHEKGVNFYVKEDKTKFFSSPVLQDILSFMALALDPRDREAFSRIYYKSYTYFTKSMCRIVTESPQTDMTVFNILDNYRYFDNYVYERISRFRADINYITRLKPKDAVRFIKIELEYLSYLERMQDEGRNNLSNAMHILEILEEIGSYCSNIKEFTEKINNLQDVLKKASENREARITLTTIHSAKGLEYDRVYMIDNIEGEFPSEARNMSDDEYRKYMEEERRIFYVGMTRARKMLNIIVPGNPSMFVNELIAANKKK
ncbi:MAG TPA: ATP-dependent helicase [Clostridiales bacterium]|nr:ATP-dependent helicase [Clostridiales bacterium]